MTDTSKNQQLSSAAILFPWSFFSVDALLLLLLPGMPRISWGAASELLVPITTPAAKPTKTSERFLQRVATLSAEEKRSVVVNNDAGPLHVRNGKVLFADFNTGEGTMFSDDPLGWMQNGLFGVDVDLLPFQKSKFHRGNYNFWKCPQFALKSGGDGSEDPLQSIIPWLHHGTRLERNRDLRMAKTAQLMLDIRDGYDLEGLEVSTRWREFVPGADIPDPVFRFILDPSAKLRDEAQLFLRQVAAARGTEPPVHDIRPRQFAYGPVICSKRSLNNALGAKPRGNVVDSRLWGANNPGGTIWKLPDTKERPHSHEFWFVDEKTFKAAKSKV